MTKPAYYNEFDPYAAQWLRNLILAGHIAPGYVDERSISDVKPYDLQEFGQCHFFAGIGVWSYSLRRAGWSDDRRVWTGSCPCQPFSGAGAGAAFDDERHLWPDFHYLIQQCRPPKVLGEQVASKDANPWIDLVSNDMEGLGYRVGAVPFPSAGVGAPHIRDRLYWVAESDHERRAGQHALLRAAAGGRKPAALPEAAGSGVTHRLGHSYSERAGRDGRAIRGAVASDDGKQRANDAGAPGGLGGLEHARHHDDASQATAAGAWQPEADRSANIVGEPSVSSGWLADTIGGQHITSGARSDQRAVAGGDGALQTPPAATGPVNGFWRDADWLFCRDGKWRPVEPGTFPLVDGAAGRVGRVRADWHAPAGPQGQGHRASRLKGYGNAINAEAARIFIECVMEHRP